MGRFKMMIDFRNQFKGLEKIFTTAKEASNFLRGSQARIYGEK